jgi:hypothetical protein
MNLTDLPNALATLYDHGIKECLRQWPELKPHTHLLLSMRWRETLLREAEQALQEAEEVLNRQEQNLIRRIELQPALHPYNAPRFNLGGLWIWTNSLRQRTLSRLSTMTRRPFLSTTGDSSSRSVDWTDAPPTASCSNGSTSTTPASAEPSTPWGSSTEQDEAA